MKSASADDIAHGGRTGEVCRSHGARAAVPRGVTGTAQSHQISLRPSNSLRPRRPSIPFRSRSAGERPAASDGHKHVVLVRQPGYSVAGRLGLCLLCPVLLESQVGGRSSLPRAPAHLCRVLCVPCEGFMCRPPGLLRLLSPPECPTAICILTSCHVSLRPSIHISIHLSIYPSIHPCRRVDWDTLPHITSEDLRDMGVVLVGERRRMLVGLAQLSGR